MRHHARRHQQHQHQIGDQRVQHARRRNVMHGKGGEKPERPAAADAGARKDAVHGLAFQPHAAPEQRHAYGKAAQHFARRAPGLQFPRQKEGHAQHQQSDAYFVQPVRAQALFKDERALRAGALVRCGEGVLLKERRWRSRR